MNLKLLENNCEERVVSGKREKWIKEYWVKDREDLWVEMCGEREMIVKREKEE